MAGVLHVVWSLLVVIISIGMPSLGGVGVGCAVELVLRNRPEEKCLGKS